MQPMDETWNPAPPAPAEAGSPDAAPGSAVAGERPASATDPRMVLALALCEGIGEMTFHRLLAVFGSPEAVFAAPEWELREACPRLGAGTLIDIRRGPDFAFVEAQAEECRRLGVRMVTWRSPDYPAPLLDLETPPPLLFMRGTWRPEDRKALAVVGTRRPSPYGGRHATSFGLGLADAGWTVVSGMARGVDTLAHEAALRGGGRTVAVLGSGLDRLYPPENADLARRIAENGCVISEFPLGVEPRPENFPRRNRIISALSRGTLVVEAGNDSGALITAEYALDQGREVFAMPGAVQTPGTRGTHKLLREGAHLAENPDDVFRVLDGLPQAAPARRLASRRKPAPVQGLLFGGPDGAPPSVAPSTPAAAPAGADDSASAGATGPAGTAKAGKPSRIGRAPADLKESHRLLLDLLGGTASTLDAVAARMRSLPGRGSLPTHRLLSELLQLEILGLVRRMPGAQFKRA